MPKLRKNSKKANKPKAGRPRGSVNGFAVQETMAAFASRWGYPLELVRQAKKIDLPGFISSGRIDPQKAIPAINRMKFNSHEMPEGCVTWKDAGEKFRGLQAQLEFKEKKKELMSVADARRQNGEAWAFVFAEIDRLCVEAPPDYAGRTAVELHARLVKFRETMREEAKKRFEEAA